MAPSGRKPQAIDLSAGLRRSAIHGMTDESGRVSRRPRGNVLENSSPQPLSLLICGRRRSLLHIRVKICQIGLLCFDQLFGLEGFSGNTAVHTWGAWLEPSTGSARLLTIPRGYDICGTNTSESIAFEKEECILGL